MLSLRHITKVYDAGGDRVTALSDVSVFFRPHEFVSVLGPSGCGKTTLLNLIGGLDRYTDGEMSVDGVSTRDYRDRDWDAYRNHRIGFVFQSYQLIPHQTVLANVELALTLSGVPRDERRRRAADVLEKVGLGDQLKKRPGQMSGGQMQRVAIARALVNDPEILLADEPTGALDTKTSEQIMDLLKEVSRDRLVIMVTHNPELADRYSTRIIRLLDGRVQSDSDPYTEEQERAEVTARAAAKAEAEREEEAKKPPEDDAQPQVIDIPADPPAETIVASPADPPAETIVASPAETPAERTKADPADKPKRPRAKAAKNNAKTKRTSMSFWTALSLSVRNLLTKKARTFLTGFAGSIGIIGIALILALSNGIQLYIDRVEADALSSYPLSVERVTISLSDVLRAFTGNAEEQAEHEEGYVYSSTAMTKMIKTIREGIHVNDLRSFKKYIETETDMTDLRVATVEYEYGITPEIWHTYRDPESGASVRVHASPSQVMDAMLSRMGMNGSGSSMVSISLFDQLLDNRELLDSQYEQIAPGGRWPQARDEVALFVDSNSEINDLFLYALGFKDPARMTEIFAQLMMTGTVDEEALESTRYAMSDLLGETFTLVVPGQMYEQNPDGTYSYRGDYATPADVSFVDEVLRRVESGDTEAGLTLKIVGVFRPRPEVAATSVNGVIGYTSALTDYLLQQSEHTDVCAAQAASPNVDVLSGKIFRDRYESITEDEKVAGADERYLAPGLTAAEQRTLLKEELLADRVYLTYLAGQARLAVIDEMTAEGLEGNAAKIEYMCQQLKGHLLDPALAASPFAAEILGAAGADASLLGEATEEDVDRMLSTYTSAPALYQGVIAREMTRFLGYLDALLGRGATVALETAKADRLAEIDALSDADVAQAYAAFYAAYAAEQKTELYDLLHADLSSSTYEENMTAFGYADPDDPQAINIYPASFEMKDRVNALIAAYNERQTDDSDKIVYTDYIGVLFSSISLILNIVKYVLIAFVSVSLVVSSIMIGIITYISVLERTREIGILRAVGASKRDVRRVFNAETMVIGFLSGVFGILATLVLTLPVNALIRFFSGAQGIGARLPFWGAIVLIVISVLLTLTAGLIPAGAAARKDPVEALRTE